MQKCMVYLKRSFSIISNIDLSWQNIKALCWLITDSSLLVNPMPQSNKSCLKIKKPFDEKLHFYIYCNVQK